MLRQQSQPPLHLHHLHPPTRPQPRPPKPTYTITIPTCSHDEITPSFIHLFSDNFINSNIQCCKFLQRFLKSSSQHTLAFSQLTEILQKVSGEHKKSNLIPHSSDQSYTVRFTTRRNHVMILMDVSHYMYRYDYATFSLSVQNLEDVMVLMFRLLTRRREEGKEEGKEEKEETGKEEEGREERQEMRISVYACAVENPELYVIYEQQRLQKQTVNELLKQIQVWLKKRYLSVFAQQSPLPPTQRLSDHIQKVLDRTKPSQFRNRLLIVSNFQDLPQSPCILTPSNWCTYGFILTGGGNFGTEIVDEERVRQHFPSGEVFKTKHFFTVKYFPICEKEPVLRGCLKWAEEQGRVYEREGSEQPVPSFHFFANTKFKERSLLFQYKQDLIEDIFDKLLVFELLIDYRRPTERSQYNSKKEVLKQYKVPAASISKLLRSRYLQGWQPIHSGTLSLNTQTYSFKLKLDRFSHLIYSATLSESRWYLIKIFHQRQPSSQKKSKTQSQPSPPPQSQPPTNLPKQVDVIQQLDRIVSDDFASLRQKTVGSIGGLSMLEHSSEMDLLMKYRNSWALFFPTRDMYFGVFRIDAKAEAGFLSAVADLLGKKLSARLYYKELVLQPTTIEGKIPKRASSPGSSQTVSPLLPRSKNQSRKIILSHFIRHNPNCIQLLLGFIRIPQPQIQSHLLSLRTRLRTLQLPQLTIKQLPQILPTPQSLSSLSTHRLTFSYSIALSSELIGKWFERHIVAWRMRENYFQIEPTLYVKVKNAVDFQGNQKQVCIYYEVRKGEEGKLELAVTALPEFMLIRRNNSFLVSFKTLMYEYAMNLKNKETKLYRLLETYLWIHRELLTTQNNYIMEKLKPKLAGIHSWTFVESEFSDLVSQLVKSYSGLTLTKDKLAALPAADQFLIDSNVCVQVGLNLQVQGQNYRALLLAPLVPILLQKKQGKIFYRVIRLPHQQSQKQLQILQDGLLLLQQQIKTKAYIQTYLQNFSSKHGGSWIHSWQSTHLQLTQFFFFWNTTITCQVNCHYFQFRRDYIAFVKQSFQKTFAELMGLVFELSGDYYFEKTFSPKSFKENAGSAMNTTYVPTRFVKMVTRIANSRTILMPVVMIGDQRFPVLGGDLMAALDLAHFQTVNVHARGAIRLAFQYTLLEPTACPPSCVNFLLGPLQEIFNEFIVDFKRLDPKMLKEEEKCMAMVRNIIPTLNNLNNISPKEFPFDLIRNQTASRRKLAELIASPAMSKIFSFCQVSQQLQFVHLLFLNSKAQQKGFITFNDRIFQFAQFRKHIIFFLPFWFILQIKQTSIQTKILLAPFNQTPTFNRSTIQLEIDKYVGQLFQLVNLNSLVSELNITNQCPSDPYELFINETTSKYLKHRAVTKPVKFSKKTKMEMKFARGTAKASKVQEEESTRMSQSQNQSQSQVRQFRLPMIYKSRVPLYQRFLDGEGLENIAKNQFWNAIELGNLPDTYKTPFKMDTLVFHFSEVPATKGDVDGLSDYDSRFKRCKNLLTYSVYSSNPELKAHEIDSIFRQNIITSQQSRVIQKMAQFLLRSPQALNQTQLNLLTKNPNHTLKIKLPYLSSYGIYLSYLRQQLTFIHKKTSRKQSKQTPNRTQSRNNSFLTNEDCCVQDSFEFQLRENDDMLFLFNFQKGQRERNTMGECLYLLEVFLCQQGTRMETISDSISKIGDHQSVSRKNKLFVCGVDPEDMTHGKELEGIVKCLTANGARAPAPLIATLEARRSSRDFDQDKVADRMDTYTSFRAAQRPNNMSLEFQVHIYGEGNWDHIEKYLQQLAQNALQDYMIQVLMSRLSRSIRDYVFQVFGIQNKHKKSMDHSDLQPIYQQNIQSLTSLQTCTVSSRSLTIHRYTCQNWDIEHLHLVPFFHSIVQQITNILTDWSSSLSPRRLHIVYYFLNQDRRPQHFGNYWETYSKKGGLPDLASLDPEELSHGELGFFICEHMLTQLSGDQHEHGLANWLKKIKKYEEDKLFSSEYHFKRHFMLKVAIHTKGLTFFSYNVDWPINSRIQKLLQAVNLWNHQKKTLKQYLLSLKQKKQPLLIPQISTQARSASILDTIHQYDQKRSKDQKKADKGLTLSLTQLLKKLVFDVMPYIDGARVYQLNQEDMARIYQIISDGAIDFEELPEPKKDFVKGTLAKLGFQALSFLRRKYLMRIESLRTIDG